MDKCGPAWFGYDLYPVSCDLCSEVRWHQYAGPTLHRQSCRLRWSGAITYMMLRPRALHPPKRGGCGQRDMWGVVPGR